MSSYEKREEAIVVPVRKLIKLLTGFQDGDTRLEQCERYALPNLLDDFRYQMVDKTLIQRSIDSLVEKFKLHGFYENAKLLKELSVKIKTDEEWSMVLLLIRLSQKPLKTLSDVSAVKSHNTASQEDKDIDWKAYLKEGWENFELPPDDSDDDECWVLSDDEDNEEGKEIVILHKAEENTSVSSSDVMNVVWILQEGLEPLQPPVPIMKHTPVFLTEKDIRIQVEHSKNWLKNHVQNSWWKSVYHEYKYKPTSELESANLADRWETFVNKDISITEQRQAIVLSEYKVLCEVIWMLQTPAECCIFYKSVEDGKFKARKNVTIPSTTMESLYSLLTSLCTYFDIVDLLHQFKQSIMHESKEDTYVPYTYKAYAAAVSNELSRINSIIMNIEREVHKQDGTDTLVTVMEQLNPVFAQLRFLCNIHIRGITDWQSEPSWICVTRLLTVLYTSLQEGVNVEMSLRLFIYSFRVYFDIIDVWLCEGRLDFQHEFLVQRECDHLKVMPYNDEMRKCGIAPVSILTKLAHVVKDAGRAVELVSRLNKLNQLRDTVDNKGFLYKEFLENVNNELQRLKCHDRLKDLKPSEADKAIFAKNTIVNKSEANVIGSKTDSYMDVEALEIKNKYDSNIENKDNKLLRNDRNESNSNVLSNNMNFESNVKKREGTLKAINLSETRNNYTRLIDSASDVDDALYTMSTDELVDNPLLYCVFEEYLKDPAENTDGEDTEDPLNSLELGGVEVLSILPLLDSQLNLVRRRCMLANKIIMESLIREHKLLQHLTVLRNVFLMDAGNIVQNFYSYLFQEIGFGDWGNSVGLSVQMKLCVEEEHPNLASNFSVIIDRKKCRSGLSIVHSALNLYFFGYNVDWPLNLIITPECIADYNKVFIFLLKIKYALWSVSNLRITDLKVNPDNRHRVYRLYGLKFWLSHCVNTIHAYFMLLAPWHSGKTLEDIVREADSIDDMISAHRKFLEAAMNHCLQDQASRLEPFIINLLHVSSQLRALWYLEIKGELTADEIGALEMDYVKVHCILGTILQAMVESAPELSANIGHLEALSYEICYALPEQSFTIESD